MLRTDGTSYRTCLACVGQGVLPQFDARLAPRDALSLAMAREAMGRNQGRGRGRDRGFRGDLSAWISGAR